MKICEYEFSGPYTVDHDHKDQGGIYVIETKSAQDTQWTVVDVGQSGQIGTRLSNHDRASCWQRHSRGQVSVFVRLTPGWSVEQRKVLESNIRKFYTPSCGDR